MSEVYVLQQAEEVIEYVVGCFDAAIVEGLIEILATTQDDRLKDLIERRLLFAYYSAQEYQQKFIL